MASRLFALFALVAALLAGTSTAAHACSCARMTPAQSAEQATAVFTGTVVAARDARSPDPAVFTFRADNVYKGTPAAEFTLATNVDSAACGYAFEKGTRYLVFAGSETSTLAEKVPGVELSSSLCSGNVPIQQGTGPLRPGDERTPGHESLAGPVDAALIAALGAPKTAPASSTLSAHKPPVESEGWIVPGMAVVAAFLAAGLAVLVIRRRWARDLD
ncbi:hypothetical protein ABZ897_48300 [Nonomuraea sp. NPDC046802]|uniref:hypothetical protein n=1 Tax=Nonomuraea sp. NPDC046802 TaxID=3154919 RepID=UPI0033F924CE